MPQPRAKARASTTGANILLCFIKTERQKGAGCYFRGKKSDGRYGIKAFVDAAEIVVGGRKLGVDSTLSI